MNYQSLYYRSDVQSNDMEERLNKAIEAKLTNTKKPQIAMIMVKTPNKTIFNCKKLGGVK